jgi:CHRD domain
MIHWQQRHRQSREENVDKTMSRRAVLVLGGVVSAAAAIGLAQAAPQSFSVALSGAQQVPAVTSPGSGTANFTFDPATRILTWSITYAGLSSPATMAHLHIGAAGKNGPIAIWLSKRGVPPTSPITGSAKLTPAQAKQFAAGDWYVNLHSKDHPAGELRGQVVPPGG